MGSFPKKGPRCYDCKAAIARIRRKLTGQDQFLALRRILPYRDIVQLSQLTGFVPHTLTNREGYPWRSVSDVFPNNKYCICLFNLTHAGRMKSLVFVQLQYQLVNCMLVVSDTRIKISLTHKLS